MLPAGARRSRQLGSGQLQPRSTAPSRLPCAGALAIPPPPVLQMRSTPLAAIRRPEARKQNLSSRRLVQVALIPLRSHDVRNAYTRGREQVVNVPAQPLVSSLVPRNSPDEIPSRRPGVYVHAGRKLNYTEPPHDTANPGRGLDHELIADRVCHWPFSSTPMDTLPAQPSSAMQNASFRSFHTCLVRHWRLKHGQPN